MGCRILTEELWNRVLENRLTEEERRKLEDHLEISCDDCHEFFSHMDDEAEQCLRTAFSNRKGASDIPAMTTTDATLTFKEVMPHIQKQRDYGFQINLQSLGWAGGLAMLVLMIAGPFSQLGDIAEPVQFDKGLTAVAAPSINLEFATGDRRANGQLVVARGEVGKTYKDSELLFLHYRIPQSGYVYLVGYQESGSVELLYPEKPSQSQSLEAGEYNIPSNHDISGMSLQGLKGRYSIAAIYSPRQLDMEKQIIPLVQQSINSETGELDHEVVKSFDEDIAVDNIYFDIRV